MINLFKMINLFQKKRRVLEVQKGDNTSIFYVQERNFMIWQNIESARREKSDGIFSSLSSANEFLADMAEVERSETIVNIKSHEFNEVFHKLSSSNTDSNTDGDSTEISSPGRL